MLVGWLVSCHAVNVCFICEISTRIFSMYLIKIIFSIFQIYSEKNKNDFPEDLAELSDVVAQYLGHEKFKAEAAIVNYYHMNSTLSAHTDHSEVNLEAPLFSFRYGL